MELNELKPCPFCGGKAKLYLLQDFGEKIDLPMVVCKKCGVQTPIHNTKNEAINAWNRRATDGT